MVQLLIHVKKNATTSLRFLKITTYKKQSLESLKVKTSYLKTKLYVHCTIFFFVKQLEKFEVLWQACFNVKNAQKNDNKTTQQWRTKICIWHLSDAKSEQLSKSFNSHLWGGYFCCTHCISTLKFLPPKCSRLSEADNIWARRPKLCINSIAEFKSQLWDSSLLLL